MCLQNQPFYVGKLLESKNNKIICYKGFDLNFDGRLT